MNDEILSIVDTLERQKGIPKETLFAAIELALLSAAKKLLGKDRTDTTVAIDRQTGEIMVKSGDKEVDSSEFGRIAAQTAKQVIIQKIREAEREVIFDDYYQRIGGIVTGSAHRIERGNIIVDLGKTEGVLPRSQQSPREKYRQGDRIRAYVLEVTKTSRGPQVILSRTEPAFIKKLFEIEVPEISEGIVEVKAISREAGERTKMAVHSKEDKIDPVGACVGMRGARVKDVVKELQGEKIDIVRWNEDIKEYLKAALSPAKISKTVFDKEKKRIEVIVEEDQLSITIGKHGQNVRLASKLIGWELDIRSKEVTKVEKDEAKTEKKEPKQKAAKSVKALAGVGKKSEKTLIEAGFDSVYKIAEAKVGDLVKLDGIGKKTAEKIVFAAQAEVSGEARSGSKIEPESGKRTTENKKQKTEKESEKSEGKLRTTEDVGETTDDGRQTTESKKQKTEKEPKKEEDGSEKIEDVID
ncbi:MAG: transcription termination factor NusA [Candidatus Omnitrophota bacterium]